VGTTATLKMYLIAIAWLCQKEGRRLGEACSGMQMQGRVGTPDRGRGEVTLGTGRPDIVSAEMQEKRRRSSALNEPLNTRIGGK